MKNIHALRQRKIDLKNKALAVCAAAPSGFSDEQRAQLKEYGTELEQVEADIQLCEAFMHEETSTGAVLAHPTAPIDIAGKKVYAKLSDQLVASGMKPTQSCESLAPFGSLSEQMRAVYIAESSRMTKVDPRLTEIQKIQAALGGNESVPAEGGFLVIPEFAQGLIKRTYDVALISSECFKMPMSSSRLIMHAVDEDSRVDGSRWGGILAYWLTEG